jgi:hypothetical protein
MYSASSKLESKDLTQCSVYSVENYLRHCFYATGQNYVIISVLYIDQNHIIFPLNSQIYCLFRTGQPYVVILMV